VKLLLCSQIANIDSRLGAARVVLDFAEAWRSHGWECDLFSENTPVNDAIKYQNALREFLIANANRYDVVDYPYTALPWIQPEHCKVLKVTRSVLLGEHSIFQAHPEPPATMKQMLSRYLRPIKARSQRRLQEANRAYREQNLRHADIINVSNSQDRTCLEKLGIPEERIAVFPYGLTDGHRRTLEANSLDSIGSRPTIAFVGTFDYRKGCLDFPVIVSHIKEVCPDVRFRLIGTKGLFVSKEAVLQFFPSHLRGSIEVVKEFEPSELANLLSDCHLGVFPSYWEGFGIGVVEMLAAGLPTIAYDVPGPCDILPTEWLVPRGDAPQMAEKLISLLRSDTETCLRAREQAREASRKFDWSEIARNTYDYYMAMANK